MAPEYHHRSGKRALELPTLVFGPIEVHRLARELEALEEYMVQVGIRDKGKQPLLPKTSRLLESLVGNNNFNLLLPADRAELAAFLKMVETNAPVVHVSLAADPSSAFTAKIVAWFRANIHPYALLHLGLQPTIAAGCIVRTNSKVFDFSLRNRFYDKRSMLLEAIEGSST